MFSNKHHIRYTESLPPQSVVDALRAERDKLMLPSARRHFAVGMTTGLVFMFATWVLLYRAGVAPWRIGAIAASFVAMAGFQGLNILRLTTDGKHADRAIVRG